MLEHVVTLAIRHRWLVLAAVLGLAGLGAYNFNRLPIDAVPDITNVQVQINTEAPGFSPLEAEQRITFPVETAISDLKAALGKNKKAKATFDGFSPSRKREYIEWITEAKQEATRVKRLKQAIEWMAEGKPRNWKYMKKW